MTLPNVQAAKRAVYPAYKPSGVAWLGDVPEHWQPIRLRYRARINPTRSELNGTPGDLDVSFVPMESVYEYGGLKLDQTRPLAEVATGYTYFRNGDVLTAKITPCFENGKGSIADGLVNGIGFGTTELHVLRPCPGLDRRFLFYFTISHAFRRLGAAEMYGAGGQKRVPDDFVRDFRQPIPSSAEQKAIAAFLDRETARIDALVEKKRRQIELLQEKRSALIIPAGRRPAITGFSFASVSRPRPDMRGFAVQSDELPYRQPELFAVAHCRPDSGREMPKKQASSSVGDSEVR